MILSTADATPWRIRCRGTAWGTTTFTWSQRPTAHHVCYRQVHALLAEAELARQQATVDALLQHLDLFVRTCKSARLRKGKQQRCWGPAAGG